MTFTNDGVVVAFISDERSPAVSLARVFPSISSADHVGGDLSWSVDIGGCAALDIGHCVDINLDANVGRMYLVIINYDWCMYIHLLQDIWLGAS